MATLKIKDADGVDRYLEVEGAGTSGDPFLPCQVAKGGRPFNLRVSQQEIANYEVQDKFGWNPDVDTGTAPEDIWEGGGIYEFSTTDDIVSISSSSASDTQNVSVLGLDATGVEVEQTVTLNGQTRVALTTALLRVYRIENQGNTDFVGDVYVYSGTTNTGGVPSGSSVEKARVTNGNNQTLMAIYTVPLGKVAFLYSGEIGISNAIRDGYAVGQYVSRRYGGVFKVKKRIALSIAGTTDYWDKRDFPDPIPALTDIKLQIYEVSDNNTAASGAFTLLLVDESELDPAFLTAIGQPSSV